MTAMRQLYQVKRAFIALLVMAFALPSFAADKASPPAAPKPEASSASSALDQLVDDKFKPVNSTEALSTAERSVVRVLVIYRGFGGVPLDTVGMGSGFIVSPGVIVTNYHVIETPPEASSAEVYIVPHKDTGAGYQPVKVIKSWVEGDLALLEAKDLKIAPLKLHLRPLKNETVVAMGYPDVTDHLLNRSGTDLLVPSDPYVTQGSIALFASTNPDGSRIETLFHTAPINHGNSGGPLLNECGQVVGVNTWTAPSTLSSGGDVDVSAGQFVATHVSALNSFLSAAGITAQTVTDGCYAKTEDEIIKDDALSSALKMAANAEIEKNQIQKKAEAERLLMERLQLAAMVILSLLVLTLIGLIIRREIRHKEELHRRDQEAPTAFSDEFEPKPDAKPTKAEKPLHIHAPKRVKKPLKHPIPWGWLLLGFIIVIGIAAFLIKDHDISKRLGIHKSTATVTTVQPLHLACEVDRGASQMPLSGAGPIDFEFDGPNACVNGRTPYERQADGTLLRFSVSETEPVAARMELSSDGSVFRRRDYHLDATTHQAFVSQRSALGSLRCVTRADLGAAEALKTNLSKVRQLSESYLNLAPASETVWRCKRQEK